jgi:hypothetical protein
MKSTLRVDDCDIELGPFVETYLANVCRAILDSLKGTAGAQRAEFRIEGKGLELLVNDQPVDLGMDKGFARVIVRDTVLGVLAHLRGTRGWTQIQVELVL